MRHRILALAVLLSAAAFAGTGVAADNTAQENRKPAKRPGTSGQPPARGVQQM